jgi:hypothetical protein
MAGNPKGAGSSRRRPVSSGSFPPIAVIPNEWVNIPPKSIFGHIQQGCSQRKAFVGSSGVVPIVSAPGHRRRLAAAAGVQSLLFLLFIQGRTGQACSPVLIRIILGGYRSDVWPVFNRFLRLASRNCGFFVAGHMGHAYLLIPVAVSERAPSMMPGSALERLCGLKMLAQGWKGVPGKRRGLRVPARRLFFVFCDVLGVVFHHHPREFLVELRPGKPFQFA